MKRVINGKTYSKIIGVKKGDVPVFGDNGELVSSGKKPSDFESKTLYSHSVAMLAESNTGFTLYIDANIITDSETAFTEATLLEYLSSYGPFAPHTATGAAVYDGETLNSLITGVYSAESQKIMATGYQFFSSIISFELTTIISLYDAVVAI